MLSLQESLNRYFRAFLVKHGQARVKTSSIHSKLTPLAGTPKIYFLALCRLKPRTQASLKIVHDVPWAAQKGSGTSHAQGNCLEEIGTFFQTQAFILYFDVPVSIIFLLRLAHLQVPERV